MSVWGWIKEKIFKKKEEPKPVVVKRTPIPPKKTAVRAIDIKGGGAVEIKGPKAWEGRGQIRYVGGGGRTAAQVEQLVKEEKILEAKPPIKPVVVKAPEPEKPRIVEPPKRYVGERIYAKPLTAGQKVWAAPILAGEFIAEKTGIQAWWKKRVAERPPPAPWKERAAAGLFGVTAIAPKLAFFSPFMATGAEQVSRIPGTEEVTYVGVQKRIPEGVRTEIAFKTSREEIGKAVGITKTKALPKGYQYGRTVTVGRFAKPAPRAKVPSPKFHLQPVGERTFVSAQQTLTRPLDGKTFEQISRGMVTRRAITKFPKPKIKFEVEKFVGIGKGVKGKYDYTYLTGRGLTERGIKVVSRGMIRTMRTPPKGDFITFVGKPVKSTKLISKQVTQDIGASLRAAVSAPAKPAVPSTLKYLGAFGLVSPKMVTKARAIPVQHPVYKPPKEVPRTTPVPRLAQPSVPRERTRPMLREKEITVPKETPIEIITPKQPVKEIPRIMPKPIPRITPREKAPPRGFIPFFPYFPTAPKGFLFPPLGIPLGWERGVRRARVPKRGFRYQPGIAALGFDITAPEIPGMAWTGIPLRPVIKKKKRKKR
jgi:hypothetical protein